MIIKRIYLVLTLPFLVFFLGNCSFEDNEMDISIPQRIVYSSDHSSFGIWLSHSKSSTQYVYMKAFDSVNNEYDTGVDIDNPREMEEEDEEYYFGFDYADHPSWVSGPNCRVVFYELTDGRVASFTFHTAIDYEVDYFYVCQNNVNYDIKSAMGSTGREKFENAMNTLLVNVNLSNINDPISQPSNVILVNSDDRYQWVLSYYNLYYDWKLFSLSDYPESDVYGISAYEGPNVPFATPEYRYAFVFQKNILDNFTGDLRSLLYWYVPDHELGHELFGLTDLGLNAEYHNVGMYYTDDDNITHYAICIMYQDIANLPIMENREYIFCQHDYPITFNNYFSNTNCVDNTFKYIFSQ